MNNYEPKPEDERDPLDHTQPVKRPVDSEQTRPSRPNDELDVTRPSRPEDDFDLTRPSHPGEDFDQTRPSRSDEPLDASLPPWPGFGEEIHPAQLDESATQAYLGDDGMDQTLPYLPDEYNRDRQNDPLASFQPVELPRGARRIPRSAAPPPPPPPYYPADYPPPPGYPPPAQPGRRSRGGEAPYDPYGGYPPPPPAPRRRRSCLGCGCFSFILPLLLLVLAYFLFPIRTNFLLLGIDRAPDGTWAGRSDTNILVSVDPLKPTVSMLSIPRDLWVNLPNVGEQRINTAHYFAEVNQPGSGPAASREAMESIFQIRVPYYARISFTSLVGIVDAMGGVRINLSEPAAGYEAGQHVLNGTQALAFARDRAGTDDFYRMEHGQLLIRAIVKQMLSPASWGRLPAVARASMEAIDTDIPIYLWPRLGLAVLRAGPDGIQSRTLNRDMVTPWTTEGGANVLLPNWDVIDPLVQEMFGSNPLLGAPVSR